MREVGDNNFIEEVENYNGVALIDFWASWCGPCKMIAPILEELSEEMGDKIKFAKLNVDDNPSIQNKYRIASIPTLMVFSNGKVAETLIGFRPKQEIKAVLEKYV